MKRFNAFYKEDQNNNQLLKDSAVFATEVRFDIIAKSEERALELIASEGENPSDFTLEETAYVKDAMGNYFAETITDSRI